MDHPIVSGDHSNLRKRVVQFLQKSYAIRRNSNIVFVCGGNEAQHMRQQFATYCEQNLHDFEILFPEYAMPNYFSDDVQEPFDIADFEEIIGQLSHAIVIFPEAAGSFAETGYFSAIDVLANRTILALNTNYQNHDSFISLGPARKIGIRSKFHPVIQIDYNNPNFDDISTRLRRVSKQSSKNLLI